ncbi:MAG: flagellar basal body-associated FliL family protein [Pseudomonadota bacterium]
MIGKLIPFVLALMGLGAGVGAGFALRPEPEVPVVMENPCGDMHMMAKEEKEGMPEDPSAPSDASAFDYVRLNNQFVVPIVRDARVVSLVVLSLSLQVESGQTEVIYQIEPKLRDSLLQVMFNHANAGGFDGPFTETARMRILRQGLIEVSQREVGNIISDVLITDIVRQDA